MMYPLKNQNQESPRMKIKFHPVCSLNLNLFIKASKVWSSFLTMNHSLKANYLTGRQNEGRVLCLL